MENRLGGISTPLQFFSPWKGGLFYGKVSSVEVAGLNPVAIAAANGWGYREFEFPDDYATRDRKKRVIAITNTFVDSEKLKRHQVKLRDELVEFVDSYRDVINYLKLLWRIAPSYSPFTEEIFDIFKLTKPPPERIDEAMFALKELTESDEWRTESEFSARSQKRHKEDTVAKRVILDSSETTSLDD
jgi:hypothetical protein